MKYAKYRWFLLPLFLMFVCVGVFAQQNSEIVGTVTDQAGAAVVGATVTVTDPATKYERTSTTNADGSYRFTALNVATYEIKVAAKGFQTYVASGISVNVSQTHRADVKLTVGADSQTVTVTADTLQVQADSNVVSTLITSEQISQIATQNRNFAALAAMGMGVSSGLPDSNTPTSVAANFTISFNGLRQSHNIWLIDGGEADDRGGAGGMDIMPSQDAIAQFETLTSNYPPDYGISSGATISLALKSGTQHFHGEGYEFVRNTAFDANAPFNKMNNPVTPRTKLNYNIFGFNIGGPVFIPKVYNESKQKTFFFWNEEWRKLIQGSSPNNVATLNPADIPTAGQNLTYVAPGFANTNPIDSNGKPQAVAGLIVPDLGATSDYNAKLAALGLTPGGCFSGTMDPVSHACSGPQVIPSALFDQNAVAYLNSTIIPKPTTTDGHAITSATLPINVVDTVIRIDQKVTDKWQLLGHYMHDSVTQNAAQPMLGWLWASFNSVTSQLSNPSNSAAIKLTGTITPNLLLEASFNYDGNVINIINSSNSFLPSGWSANTFFKNGSTSFPSVQGWGNPYNVAEAMGSAPWHNAAQDYSPKVDVSYSIGKHQTKFGFSYNRYTKNQQIFGERQGNYSFGTHTGNSQYIGDSFMDMLLGITNGYNQVQQAPIRHYVNQTPSVYAMDNWRMTPRLSIQYGLRYDALPHVQERNNQVANFDPATYLSSLTPTWLPDGSMDPLGPGFQTPAGATQPFYLNGMGLAGQNGYPPGLVTNDYKTLQPRIGFSEDVFGTGKTILRGGFGTFYERMQGNDIYNAATNAPFFNNPGATNVYFSNPSTSWVTGNTAALPFFAQGMQTLAHTYRAPAVAMFSLGVQHQLAPSVILVVQYVGNLAWHQNIDRNINNYNLNTPLQIRADAGDSSNNSGTNPLHASLANGNIYRQFQGYGGVNEYENNTNGNYNGFQTGVRVQNKWGLSGEIDYTYSHEIDLTSYDLNNASNPYNLKYDKGSGALDRRQMLNANYVYNLPIFNKSGGVAHAVLGGWQLAGTFIGQTGAPQSSGLSLSYDPIGLGGGYTNRPNVGGQVNYPHQLKKWFNTAQFSAPTPVWVGGPNQGFGNAGKDAIQLPGRVNFTTSLYKTFAITEQVHFEFRAESFNTFNSFQYNGVNASLNNSQFGQVTSAFDPRTLEFGGKITF
jgi:Carboxypeptidase regulatory-like domain